MSTKFLKQDLKDVKSQLKKQYNCDIPKKREKQFTFLHKRVFCLSNLGFQLIKQDSIRMEFLEELRSDLVHLLTCISLGLKKPSALSTRGCIESTIRHIYYKDHPIELQLLNQTGETKISVTETFNYLNEHPVFKKIDRFCKMYSFLKNEYSETSKLIHGSSFRHFQLSKSISQLKITDQEFTSQTKNLEKLLGILITVIIIFHKKTFNQIHHEHRDLIFSCVSPTQKKMIHGI